MLLNCHVGEDSSEFLDCKEIQPVHPEGNQSWVFIGRTDAEAEIPVIWPPDMKNWVVWKDPDAGKDCGQEEKWTTEDEMVRWHPWLNEQVAEMLKDRKAWRVAVHGVTESQTRLSDWTTTKSSLMGQVLYVHNYNHLCFTSPHFQHVISVPNITGSLLPPKHK